MPALPEFVTVAENMAARTVALSGDSSAAIFSALASLAQLWQWYRTDLEPLTPEDVDYIQALMAKANTEMMTPLIGQILPYVTSAAPTNTLPCDGGSYTRTDYPELYAALDAAFIVDADNFVTPDLRGRTVIGAGAAASGTTYSVGETGGVEDVTLNESQMPSHSHSDLGHAHSYVPAVPSLTTPGELPVPVPTATPGASLTGFASANIQPTGGDGAHENRPPFLALKYAVVAR